MENSYTSDNEQAETLTNTIFSEKKWRKKALTAYNLWENIMKWLITSTMWCNNFKETGKRKSHEI